MRRMRPSHCAKMIVSQQTHPQPCFHTKVLRIEKHVSIFWCHRRQIAHHTRCEKSEQSLRKQLKKIISSKYYDQAILFRVTAESNPLSIHLIFWTNCDNAAVTQIWRNKRQEWLIKKPLSCSVSKSRFLGTWKLFCSWAPAHVAKGRFTLISKLHLLWLSYRKHQKW